VDEQIFPDLTIPDGLTNHEAGSDAVSEYGKELAFDFTRGELIIENGRPKLVEGIDAVKIWIEKTLRTARYRYPIYSFEYGCELEDLIGIEIPSDVLESEIKRVIAEAIIYDDRIESVEDFKISRSSDCLHLTFRVVTVFGDSFTQEVNHHV
jgi:phage baseplate assembly protein W